jgi:hypothetical protein
VPHLLQYFNFPAYSLDVLLVFDSGFLQDLDGDLLACQRVHRQFNFAEGAFAQCLSKDVVAQSRTLGVWVVRVRVVLAVGGLSGAMALFPGIIVIRLIAS